MYPVPTITISSSGDVENSAKDKPAVFFAGRWGLNYEPRPTWPSMGWSGGLYHPLSRGEKCDKGDPGKKKGPRRNRASCPASVGVLGLPDCLTHPVPMQCHPCPRLHPRPRPRLHQTLAPRLGRTSPRPKSPSARLKGWYGGSSLLAGSVLF